MSEQERQSNSCGKPACNGDVRFCHECATVELKDHPALENCTTDECELCGIRDCPKQSFEHYWGDGCPSCYVPPAPTTGNA